MNHTLQTLISLLVSLLVFPGISRADTTLQGEGCPQKILLECLPKSPNLAPFQKLQVWEDQNKNVKSSVWNQQQDAFTQTTNWFEWQRKDLTFPPVDNFAYRLSLGGEGWVLTQLTTEGLEQFFYYSCTETP